MKSYRSAILEEAGYGGLPLVYLPLSEVNGTSAADVMAQARGTSNPGTYTSITSPGNGWTVGTLGLAPGAISRDHGGAAKFVRTSPNDYVNVAHDAGINPGTTMTAECWIKAVLPNSFQGLLHKGPTSLALGWELSASSTSIRFVGRNPATDVIGSAGSIPTNTWTHVAITYDGANVRLYAAGALVGGPTARTATVATTEPLRIGQRRNAASEQFDGQIAHVALYDYALAADRIKYHYLAGLRGLNPLLGRAA